MPGEMVSRVARAIALQHAVAGRSTSKETWVERNWTLFVPDARAAIEAMREPSETMIAAAWTERSSLDEAPTPGATFKLLWQAMIDEALQ